QVTPGSTLSRRPQLLVTSSSVFLPCLHDAPLQTCAGSGPGGCPVLSAAHCDEQLELQVAARSRRSNNPCLTSLSTTLPATVHLQPHGSNRVFLELRSAWL
ncbi:unnamed protein product, partial [Urochloa humidicola]